jgi:hypothetical protein
MVVLEITHKQATWRATGVTVMFRQSIALPEITA